MSGNSSLKAMYENACATNEPVFNGQPLSFFAKMSARRLFEYKESHPGFGDSWVFKAILENNGPVFFMIATTGDDVVPTNTSREEDVEKKIESRGRITRLFD